VPRLSLYVIVSLLLIIGGLAWFIRWTVMRAEDPARMLFKWILTFIILGFFGFAVFKQVGFSVAGAYVVPFVCVLIGVIMSVIWAPHIGTLIAKPLTSMFDGGDMAPEPQPLYSIAVARRKRGQYQEAIYHIQEQLEKFPHDAVGQMLLAEIQADDLKDLQAAEITVNRFSDQSGHAPGAVAMALHQLADWRLKYAQDIDSAMEALQRIVDRYPNTEQAQVAAQRISHLGRREMTFGMHDPVKLREGVVDIGLLAQSAHLKPGEDDPATKAQEYVAHLEQYPADAEVREKLAAIYAEHYQRPDMAVAQLEELVQRPNQPAKLVAHWLNRIADLHVKHNSDLESARAALERIIETYPGSAHAEKARQRIEYLRLSLRVKQATRAVQLGSYEQDIGLKQQRPKP
jgi:TolA-binding protein